MAHAILVAGGAGYIGAHVCKALAAAGHTPVVLDDFSAGHREFVKFGPVVEACVSDAAKVSAAITEHKIVAVIDLAGSIEVAESVKNPLKYYDNNVAKKIPFLKTLTEAGITAFVFSSTAAVYGEPTAIPIPESHATSPTNPYGWSKLMFERLLHSTGAASGLRFMALRYFNAAGASLDGEIGEAHEPETHLIPRACLASLGAVPPLEIFGNDYPTKDGTALRDYIHVMDLADAHVKAVEALLNGAPSAAYNLGNGIGTTIGDIIAVFEKMGHAVPHSFKARRAGDPSKLVADSSAAKAALNWQPQHDIETIIRSAYAWHAKTAAKGKKRMSRPLFSQNIDHALTLVERKTFDAWCGKAGEAIDRIAKTPMPEMTAMFKLPAQVDDLAEIEAIGTQIAENYTNLVIVGMGGSSLGGETLATALRKQGGLTLHYLDNIDPLTIAVLVESLPWARTAFLIVSKSGTTIETLALFAVLLREAKARAGAAYAKAFTIITIPNGNATHRIATEHGMRVVAHDKDLCGRFAILSAVGLIPAAAVGVDIRALRAGANITLTENLRGGQLAAAGEVAALHMSLRDKNIAMHVMMHYCDRFGGLLLWHRQCWAESLGKNGQGTTPLRSRGVTDQHSQLQLYLEGPRDKFFTSLILDMGGQGASIGFDSGDESLSYLNGHTLGDLSMAEQRATNATLVAAGVPVRTITCATLDETVLGALLMHFTLEVTLTAALMGVNAFNQPAVEAGKKLALEYLAGR